MNTTPRAVEGATATAIPAHNIFTFDNGVTISSNFDNGNVARVERLNNRPFEFKVWTAPDNLGTPHQSRHSAWFHFVVTGLPMGCVLRIQIVNAAASSGLYKHDMRPVYRCNATNQKWCRIKTSLRFIKDGDAQQLFFEHSVEANNDKIYFAFTYPYDYGMLMQELDCLDAHVNQMSVPGSIFYKRELLTESCDGRRIDLLTITSVDGVARNNAREPLLSGLFPEFNKPQDRVPIFPEKEVIFVSARVHAGEVPAQHTFKGILDLLMDPNDLCAIELRSRFVFKLIPMLNPDGVYRGHFRMDQMGHNLNRYYVNPDATLQPAIFAAKSLLDYYAGIGKLAMYLDMHAHASKRGCFIYGNVLDGVEDQIQNQLYCKLISMNSAHFDYEGCLFSREHMYRTDPGDQAKGLTAEGSGRVNTYLAYGLIHSYTLECNYNTSRIGNEIAPPEQELNGSQVTPASPFTTNPDKYTPSIYAGVGRACIIAMLDIRGANPCSRIPKSKLKTLDRVRNAVVMEVRNRKEYMGKPLSAAGASGSASAKEGSRRRSLVGPSATQSEEFQWRRVVEGSLPNSSSTPMLNGPAPAVQSGELMFIPAKDKRERPRRSTVKPSSGADDGNSSGYNTPRSSTPLTVPNAGIQSSSECREMRSATHVQESTCRYSVVRQVKESVQTTSDEGIESESLSRELSAAHMSNGTSVTATKTKLQSYFKGNNTAVDLSVASSYQSTAAVTTAAGEGVAFLSSSSSGSAREPLVHMAGHSREFDLPIKKHASDSSSVQLPTNKVIPIGSSVRDLIREQSINKLIRMSYQQNALAMNPGVPVPKRPVPVPSSLAQSQHQYAQSASASLSGNVVSSPMIITGMGSSNSTANVGLTVAGSGVSTTSSGAAAPAMPSSLTSSPGLIARKSFAKAPLQSAGVSLIINGANSSSLANSSMNLLSAVPMIPSLESDSAGLLALPYQSPPNQQLNDDDNLPAVPADVLRSSSKSSLKALAASEQT